MDKLTLITKKYLVDYKTDADVPTYVLGHVVVDEDINLTIRVYDKDPNKMNPYHIPAHQIGKVSYNSKEYFTECKVTEEFKLEDAQKIVEEILSEVNAEEENNNTVDREGETE